MPRPLQRLMPVILVLACLLGWLTARPACANDVLVVQSSSGEAYVKATTAFSEAVSVGVSLPGVSSFRQTQVLLLSGDPQEDSQIVARKHQELRPSLILALGTRALAASRDLSPPIVYCLVPNPDALATGRKNITGVRMALEPAVELAAIQRLLPDRRRIGVLFHPNHGRDRQELTRKAASALGLTLVDLPADTDRQAAVVAREMADRLDLILMNPDSSLVSPPLIDSLALLSLERRLPVTAFAPKYLADGAALAIYSSPEQQATQAAGLVKRILQSSTSSLPAPEYAKEIELRTNPTILQKLGITLMTQGQGNQP